LLPAPPVDPPAIVLHMPTIGSPGCVIATIELALIIVSLNLFEKKLKLYMKEF
jgi:hypothetical protein